MTEDAGLNAMPTILKPEFESLAIELLRDYYLATTSSGRPWFTGARFETIGSPWHEPSNADRFTAEDVVAVSCLSVPVPGAAAIRILERQADQIGDLLTAMPRSGVPLWEVSPAEYGPDSAAGQLWRLLRDGKDGLGPTTVSKLMARKRAALAPIYDSVVAGALDWVTSAGYWEKVRQMMLTSIDEVPLHQRLGAMAADAQLGPLVTPLRVLDVLLWYAYNPKDNVKARAQGLADELSASGVLPQEWDAGL